jgi:hypothetical protein
LAYRFGLDHWFSACGKAAHPGNDIGQKLIIS